ncbi:MAG: hypothetical protein E7649_02505 [Ruminococcaceae bacterium]|nr:hypothetical protein [Oscillospiraceae bacterium]
MEKFKKILKAIAYPYLPIVFLLCPVAVALLVYAFVFVPDNDAVNYISYVISAYTLMIVCFRIPNMIKWIKKFIENNKYASKLKGDAHLKIKLSLGGTLAYNALYSVFQLALGIYNNSAWFYSLAAYYFLLAFMKACLLNHTMKFAPGEKQFREVLIYRMCGIGLVLMNLAFVVIIAYVTAYSKTTVNGEIMTIMLAAFTFTTMTVAIVNIVKYRKYHSPVFSASKAISFVSALVSMLTLEDAMLATFGQAEGDGFRQLMGGLSGAAVVAVVLALAISMIVRSTKQIKTFDNKNPLQ